MGTNDHIPNKQQRTARRKRNEPKILQAWDAAAIEEVAPFVSAVSEAGGYIGLGRNSTGDCLLLYVKLDSWSERIAIEAAEHLADTVAELLEELAR